MNKYERLKAELKKQGHGKMKCFGNSMLPILHSSGTLSFRKQKKYKIGDIVFCKVRGRMIDAHKITKVDVNRGYLISNNHGHDNGWTKTIYGRAVYVEYTNKESKKL